MSLYYFDILSSFLLFLLIACARSTSSLITIKFISEAGQVF